MNTYISNNLSFLGSSTGATVGTSQTTTSTTYADLATVGPAVTVSTQTTALVFLTAVLSNSTGNNTMWMSFAVSGGTTIAAADATGIVNQSYAAAAGMGIGGTFFTSGLNATSNTFTGKYRVNATTGTAQNRYIAVIPLTT